MKQDRIPEQKLRQQQEYNEYVKQVTPTYSLGGNMLKAFIVGGVICTIGQAIIAIAKSCGADEEMAPMWCTLILVLLSVLLTGLNIYPTFAKWGGAGALVPITGFANSVAAPAIEFRGSEGNVFGCGAKIFTICGPVILYGIFTSWILGVIYYIWTCL
ncbi:MAG: SpoVA/SpoVAEb family sporulation membrane protein [bacterium]|nr:SpoVA/SpoVAEb family sporulation membrane protein [bacterium]